MFDKLAYWKNRKEGKRGQGELPKSEVKRSGLGSGRKQFRKKVRNTDDGTPYTQKGVKHELGGNEAKVRSERRRSHKIKEEI